MKKLFLLILPSLIFYGCGSSSNPDGDNLNLAQAAAAQYLNSECKSRIEEQKYWLAAKILLADKADKYKEQIVYVVQSFDHFSKKYDVKFRKTSVEC